MTIPFKIIRRTFPGVKGGGKRVPYPKVAIRNVVSPDDFHELMKRKIRWSEADITFF